MSALARWFFAQNWAVSGSDVAHADIIKELRKDGIRVKIGQNKARIPLKTGLVVYNQAIQPQNPELKEARRRKMPVLSYPEVLGVLSEGYTAFAVSGSHGKSTTTVFLSLMLGAAGFDPTVIVGTKVPQFGNSNFRKGDSRYLVLEADEFHSSFLEYSPAFGIITNIDQEHLDWYKNLGNIKRAFLSFVKNFKEGGILVLNRDDATLRSLKIQLEKICRERDVLPAWYSLSGKQAGEIKESLSRIPGKHNASNAVAAATLARELGVSAAHIKKALRSYAGAWRRMEFKGTLPLPRGSADVYDDYGHHPTEIRKTLEGAKEFFLKKNIICVFQPHQEKRLHMLFQKFKNAFEAADAVILLPTYTVAGRDAKKKTLKSSEDLFREVKKRKSRAFFARTPGDIKKIISEMDSLPYRNSVLIMMGAGTINEYTEKLFQ